MLSSRDTHTHHWLRCVGTFPIMQMPFVYAVVSVILLVARVGAGVCGSGEVRWAAVGIVSRLYGMCLEFV